MCQAHASATRLDPIMRLELGISISSRPKEVRRHSRNASRSFTNESPWHPTVGSPSKSSANARTYFARQALVAMLESVRPRNIRQSIQLRNFHPFWWCCGNPVSGPHPFEFTYCSTSSIPSTFLGRVVKGSLVKHLWPITWLITNLLFVLSIRDRPSISQEM